MADDTPPPCFVCDGVEHRRLFVKAGRSFWECRGCGLQKQHPLPTPDELAAFYEESYGSGMYQEFAAATKLKELTAQRRLKELEGLVPMRGRWLDVGASTGVFPLEAARLGIEAEGVELSDSAVAVGRQNGAVMHAGDLASLDGSSPYDCVTAFDLIEHVLDPARLVEEARDRLVDGGWLVMTLPDLGSLQRRLMGERWYFYIPEEHLHYFRRRVMRRFLERSGFEVVAIRATYKPMTFDYAQTQFQEYNPLIHRVLSVGGALLPRSLRRWPAPLPIGEMCAVARVKR